MLKIGITGGMGSGKSYVCRLFALYGAPGYDCDARARELMDADSDLIAAITALLGPEAYRAGKLDRQWVASRIFAEAALLRQFDELVHPAVARDVEAWAANLPAETPYGLIESAILFESGFDRMVDRSVAVQAPVELRIERIMQRSPRMNREDIMRRIAHQMDEQERAQRADYQIINDGSHSLLEQVARLHETFARGLSLE